MPKLKFESPKTSKSNHFLEPKNMYKKPPSFKLPIRWNCRKFAYAKVGPKYYHFGGYFTLTKKSH